MPGPHDWLTLNAEPGQTFAEFCARDHARPDGVRRVIYLLPLGIFPAETSPPLEEIRNYAAAFFQMDVKVLAAFTPTDGQFEPRRNPRYGQRQILAGSVIDFLKEKMPADGYCLLGVTMEDLYPEPAWNYVFGQASIYSRTGIYSFVRYDPAFWRDARGRDYKDVILRRSCRVLAHEVGHMFGLWHCIYYDCVLNGGNNMVESDASPQHLCPICLRKLHYSIGFDPGKRYRELAEFYRRHKWTDELRWTNHQLTKPSPK